MKPFILLSCTLTLMALTACGATPVYLNVAPGSPMPGTFIAVCKAHDTLGRCTDWSANSDTCISPDGVNANPPTVPCASIKK